MKKLLNQAVISLALLTALNVTSSAVAADLATTSAPETLEAAVVAVIARMSPSQKSIVKGTAKDSLFLLLGEWGDDIEERLNLKSKNNKLAAIVCKKACTSEESTLIIMHAAWEVLQR
jgi:hypothetical protein